MRRRESSGREAQEQLILLSASTSARRQAMRGQAEWLAERVDWRAITERLRDRRLLPTLGPRMLDLPVAEADDEFRVAVEQALHAGRRQSAFLQLIVAHVRTALLDAEIRSTPLKGPQLGEVLYGEPGRRMSGDIDLLVAREQLSSAVNVVRALGYAPPSDHVDDRGLPSLHFALVHERGEWPPIELHWRIHCYEGSFAEQRLLVPDGNLPEEWRPAPVDELAALLLFYARDGFMNLRLATDVGAWWDAFGSSLEPAALDEPMRDYPALERVLLVAATVAKQTVGLPVEQLTQRHGRLDRRGRLAARLATPHPRVSEQQLYADMGLIDGLLAPPGGLRAYVKRQVIPPREVLRARTHTSAGAHRPSSPLGHGVRVVGRYVLAMARLLRAPAEG